MDYRKLPYTMMNRVLITLKNWIKGYQYCFRKASDFIFRQCPRLIGDFHTVEELNNSLVELNIPIFINEKVAQIADY